jgi:DNA mismatch endonuclease (patch repair protein)
MTDIFTPEKRSEVMSRIRGRDTKPELALRSLLHRLGYRFTVNGPKNRSLPGKPDLVLPKYQTVIFVHGCFWHGHQGCSSFRLPKSRVAWWKAKIHGNQARDLRNENSLRNLGWHVVTIWECALKNPSARLWLIQRLPELLGRAPAPAPESLPMVADDQAPYRCGKRGMKDEE